MAAPTGNKNIGMKIGFGINCDINPTTKVVRNTEHEMFRVARYNLRNHLVEEVKRSSSVIDFQWNSHAIKADYDKITNKVTVELQDGRRDECNLLIVADAMHSSVRRYMFPEIKLNFHKPILLTSQGVSVFLAPIDEKSFFWFLSYHSEQPRSPPLIGSAMNKDEQENLINEIVARSMNCLSNEFRSFVKRCDRQRLLIINCYDKFPHQNPSEKHVIFIGDALHPMSSMGGNSANMAIRDGVEFIEVLIKNYGTNNKSIATNTDHCIFNSTTHDLPLTWSFSTIDQVKLCFDNIPVNNLTINETMKQLFNSLEFYSFLSIIRQSNQPYFTNVNLHNELLSILHQSNMNMYKNDYDFHMTIVTCFKKLKDFHTKYFAPNGYSKFELLLPFILEFLPSTTQIKIKLGIHLYSSIIGNKLNMNYTDKIITKIDGIDTLEYMNHFAEHYSFMSKDKNVRLNSVFRKEFWLRNLGQYPLPLKNNITFTFFDQNTETTVTFPYLIIITKKFDNQISLENENRFSSSLPSETENVFNYIIDFEKLNWYKNNHSNNFELIMGNNDSYYYIHKSTQTAIIKLESFNEENFEDIKKIFLAAKGNTLILDLIGNHGGHSCLAYGLLNYLVPEYSSLHLLYEPVDGRTTKSLRLFSKIFSFYPNSILNIQTGLSFTNMSWIEPAFNYTRGNSTDEYSMRWSINCDGEAFGMGKFWIKNNERKYFQSIYVLTDGTCGSACSLFLSKLKFASNFKTIYGIGGGYNDNDLFESSSYAGGGAFQWNDIVTYHNQFSTNDSFINHLPTSAQLNLNVYEIYINALSSDYPREFLKQPIDKRLLIADYFNSQQSLEMIIDDYTRSNSQTLTDAPAVNADPTQPSTLPEHFRRRKLIRIDVSILIFMLIMTGIIVVIVKKKTEDKTTSITEGSTVELTIITTEPLTTKIIISEMIETTMKEQLFTSVATNNNMKWKQNASTIAGGHGRGSELNQLNDPSGIYVDDDNHSIYVADRENHRIVRWEFGADVGEIVAGGNGPGYAINQLRTPTDVVLDKEKKYLIICDYHNIRVMRRSLQNSQNQQILIYGMLCCGLAIDNNGTLYITDGLKHRVSRWQEGDTEGTVVAGGNNEGNHFNQLNLPNFIFVDEYHSVYIADNMNDRVMKWMKTAIEGTLVAPGQIAGENPNSLCGPEGVIVDHMGNIYVSNGGSHQIKRWSPGAIEGVPVVGEKERGNKSTQLINPGDLSLDREGNLYVVDRINHRIQKFAIDLD
ncbi:unnamed protein product [Adineta steineri]|uniref:FAD-binding domain-containing protein n=1 Tax=Adineta steineri TaxID=433720 RepID=A0A815MXB0_9BILA|nr:unnamed protein product [Adineta steineri]